MSPIKPISLPQISYRGMRDSFDPSTADPRLATLMQNVYPVDAEQGAADVGRPGYQQSGDSLAGPLAPLWSSALPLWSSSATLLSGAVLNSRVQAIYQFSRLDGTEYTVAFAGGMMYTFDWIARAWTGVAMTGVSLSAGGIIYLTTYNNQMVVNPNDGINKPWMWDGTTFTSLTNAPVAFGQPTVYYAKLFLIRWLNRTTIDWSEENSANTGYTVGFNNTWQLGQTDQHRLVAIFGSDSALYYWRERSLGYISGQVTPNFSSSGVRDAISTTVGTTSPAGIVPYESAVFFLSADARPYRLDLGGGLTPLWTDLRETIPTFPRSLLPIALGTGAQGLPGDPLTYLVALGVADVSQSDVTTLIMIDTRTNLIAGLWKGFTSTALAWVKDANLQPVLMHGTANGYVYDHGVPGGSSWNDQANASDGGTNAIAHQITGTPLGWSVQKEKYWERLDLSLRVSGTFTLSVGYVTPYETGPTQTITLAGINPVAWDGTWDGAWAGNAVETHAAIGINALGNRLAPIFTHAVGAEQFGLVGVVAKAYPTSDEARAR